MVFFWALTGPYPMLRFGGACGLGVGAYIEDEVLGFLNKTPRISMITHLQNRGGVLDFADTKTLLAERDQEEWDTSEVPTLYFNRVVKAMQDLTRAGITSNLKERTDMAPYYLKSTR